MIAFVSFSCNQSTEDPAPDLNKKFFVPISVAKKIARQVNLANPYQNIESQSNKRTEYNLLSDEIVIEDNGSPLFYIFKMQDNGSLIISADFRAVPFLAYGDGGFPDDIDDVNVGLASILDEYMTYIMTTRDTIDHMTPDIYSMWAAHEGIDGQFVPVDECGNQPCESGGGGGGAPIGPTTSNEGNSTTTTWELSEVPNYAQGGDFNDRCPTTTCAGGEETLVGCVPVAMAQIMAYWERPSSYNWDIIRTTTAASVPIETAQLLRDCGNAAGTTYGCGVSSTDSNDAFRAFKNDFGYSNDANYKNFDLAEARQEIKATRPLYLRACRTKDGVWSYTDCHAWVSDGYQEVTTGTTTNWYFRMNWGWGEGDNRDRYYLQWSWNPNGNNLSTDNYRYKRKMIVNLHPD